jgi:hypothetical protein
VTCHAVSSLFVIFGVLVRLTEGAVDVQRVVFLGPLPSKDGCWTILEQFNFNHWSRYHTLQELLAGILLEEGFVADGAVEVVHHQAEDRVDLFFRIPGVVGQSGILYPY